MLLNFLSGKLLIICSTLLAIACAACVVLYVQLGNAREDLSERDTQLKLEQEKHATTIRLFSDSVQAQNNAIAELKHLGDIKQEQVAKVQQQLAAARRERDELLDRLRATPTATLTCTESMELLNDSIPSLVWEPKLQSIK